MTGEREIAKMVERSERMRGRGLQQRETMGTIREETESVRETGREIREESGKNHQHTTSDLGRERQK